MLRHAKDISRTYVPYGIHWCWQTPDVVSVALLDHSNNGVTSKRETSQEDSPGAHSIRHRALILQIRKQMGQELRDTMPDWKYNSHRVCRHTTALVSEPSVLTFAEYTLWVRQCAERLTVILTDPHQHEAGMIIAISQMRKQNQKYQQICTRSQQEDNNQ
jgi:hypothetical protein